MLEKLLENVSKLPLFPEKMKNSEFSDIIFELLLSGY
jgi:hypothetical protein